MTDERDALKAAALALQSWCGERGEQLLEEFLAAADVYGDARELKGHVAACILRDWSALPQGKRELTQSEVEDLLPKCGQGGWYCPKAPRGPA